MANLEIYKFDHVVSFFNLFHIEHNFTKKQLIIINVGYVTFTLSADVLIG